MDQRRIGLVDVQAKALALINGNTYFWHFSNFFCVNYEARIGSLFIAAFLAALSTEMIFNYKQIIRLIMYFNFIGASTSVDQIHKTTSRTSSRRLYFIYTQASPIQREVNTIPMALMTECKHAMSNSNLGFAVIEEPPFEIEEEGWGEFELAITLYFTDPTEKAVDLYHTLKVSLFCFSDPLRGTKSNRLL